MKVTLAPIPFYWPRATMFEFYGNIATSQVDRVILGETVCSKRRELNQQDYIDIADKLAAKGKEVFISSLALLEAESELKSLTSLCKVSPYPLEANDLAAAELCFQQQRSFIGGPYLNNYSPETLKMLQRDGMTSWTLPFELGKQDLEDFMTTIHQENIDLETEVMVHGYIPLALSARCFTARALDLPKDKCQRKCIDYPVGIPVDSQEDERLFTINGIQTLSGDILDLRSEVTEMQAMGVDRIRVVPSQIDMRDILDDYCQAANGKQLAPAKNELFCNGYWYGQAGKSHISA
ncbi:U32 family peptidase [Reinekea sp.]|jgi:collagenase-like PrtC family protease|uniref:U32 family peptidase n=1 Tax=Reinekea sp. TaxID=1970455 RepID=UPI003989BF42